MKRQITSISMLLVFVVLCISGILSYFTEYTRVIATVHTVFGVMFTIAAVAHVVNNNKVLLQYLKKWIVLPLLISAIGMIYIATTEGAIIRGFMDYGARSKAKSGVLSEDGNYAIIEMSLDRKVLLNLEVKRAQHFWHPQIAVWTEDTLGNYLETLYVTKATAKGIFSGGRTKDNFKALDSMDDKEGEEYRRVDALPVWSHKRGVIYDDGLYSPTFDQPLPDGLSGATPLDNFNLKSSVDYDQKFIVKLEINVAFDDNEYYSEYDFADDKVFHNGTGQLGQPSIVYRANMDPQESKAYQIMHLQGHGHHSGQDGKIVEDLSKLSTALEIVEYIVIGLNK